MERMLAITYVTCGNGDMSQKAMEMSQDDREVSSDSGAQKSSVIFKVSDVSQEHGTMPRIVSCNTHNELDDSQNDPMEDSDIDEEGSNSKAWHQMVDGENIGTTGHDTCDSDCSSRCTGNYSEHIVDDSRVADSVSHDTHFETYCCKISVCHEKDDPVTRYKISTIDEEPDIDPLDSENGNSTGAMLQNDTQCSIEDGDAGCADDSGDCTGHEFGTRIIPVHVHGHEYQTAQSDDQKKNVDINEEVDDTARTDSLNSSIDLKGFFENFEREIWNDMERRVCEHVVGQKDVSEEAATVVQEVCEKQRIEDCDPCMERGKCLSESSHPFVKRSELTHCCQNVSCNAENETGCEGEDGIVTSCKVDFEAAQMKDNYDELVNIPKVAETTDDCRDEDAELIKHGNVENLNEIIRKHEELINHLCQEVVEVVDEDVEIKKKEAELMNEEIVNGEAEMEDEEADMVNEEVSSLEHIELHIAETSDNPHEEIVQSLIHAERAAAEVEEDVDDSYDALAVVEEEVAVTQQDDQEEEEQNGMLPPTLEEVAVTEEDNQLPEEQGNSLAPTLEEVAVTLNDHAQSEREGQLLPTAEDVVVTQEDDQQQQHREEVILPVEEQVAVTHTDQHQEQEDELVPTPEQVVLTTEEADQSTGQDDLSPMTQQVVVTSDPCLCPVSAADLQPLLPLQVAVSLTDQLIVSPSLTTEIVAVTQATGEPDTDHTCMQRSIVPAGSLDRTVSYTDTMTSDMEQKSIADCSVSRLMDVEPTVAENCDVDLPMSNSRADDVREKLITYTKEITSTSDQSLTTLSEIEVMTRNAEDGCIVEKNTVTYTNELTTDDITSDQSVTTDIPDVLEITEGSVEDQVEDSLATGDEIGEKLVTYTKEMTRDADEDIEIDHSLTSVPCVEEMSVENDDVHMARSVHIADDVTQKVVNFVKEMTVDSDHNNLNEQLEVICEEMMPKKAEVARPTCALDDVKKTVTYSKEITDDHNIQTDHSLTTLPKTVAMSSKLINEETNSHYVADIAQRVVTHAEEIEDDSDQEISTDHSLTSSAEIQAKADADVENSVDIRDKVMEKVVTYTREIISESDQAVLTDHYLTTLPEVDCMLTNNAGISQADPLCAVDDITEKVVTFAKEMTDDSDEDVITDHSLTILREETPELAEAGVNMNRSVYIADDVAKREVTFAKPVTGETDHSLTIVSTEDDVVCESAMWESVYVDAETDFISSITMEDVAKKTLTYAEALANDSPDDTSLTLLPKVEDITDKADIDMSESVHVAEDVSEKVVTYTKMITDGNDENVQSDQLLTVLPEVNNMIEKAENSITHSIDMVEDVLEKAITHVKESTTDSDQYIPSDHSLTTLPDFTLATQNPELTLGHQLHIVEDIKEKLVTFTKEMTGTDDNILIDHSLATLPQDVEVVDKVVEHSSERKSHVNCQKITYTQPVTSDLLTSVTQSLTIRPDVAVLAEDVHLDLDETSRSAESISPVVTFAGQLSTDCDMVSEMTESLPLCLDVKTLTEVPVQNSGEEKDRTNKTTTLDEQNSNRRDQITQTDNHKTHDEDSMTYDMEPKSVQISTSENERDELIQTEQLLSNDCQQSSLETVIYTTTITKANNMMTCMLDSHMQNISKQSDLRKCDVNAQNIGFSDNDHNLAAQHDEVLASEKISDLNSTHPHSRADDDAEIKASMLKTTVTTGSVEMDGQWKAVTAAPAIRSDQSVDDLVMNSHCQPVNAHSTKKSEGEKYIRNTFQNDVDQIDHVDDQLDVNKRTISASVDCPQTDHEGITITDLPGIRPADHHLSTSSPTAFPAFDTEQERYKNEAESRSTHEIHEHDMSASLCMINRSFVSETVKEVTENVAANVVEETDQTGYDAGEKVDIVNEDFVDDGTCMADISEDIVVITNNDILEEEFDHLEDLLDLPSKASDDVADRIGEVLLDAGSLSARYSVHNNDVHEHLLSGSGDHDGDKGLKIDHVESNDEGHRNNAKTLEVDVKVNETVLANDYVSVNDEDSMRSAFDDSDVDKMELYQYDRDMLASCNADSQFMEKGWALSTDQVEKGWSLSMENQQLDCFKVDMEDLFVTFEKPNEPPATFDPAATADETIENVHSSGDEMMVKPFVTVTVSDETDAQDGEVEDYVDAVYVNGTAVVPNVDAGTVPVLGSRLSEGQQVELLDLVAYEVLSDEEVKEDM